MNNTVESLAKEIKLLILDIDGVCTDGRLYFGNKGEIIKCFHVHDGIGIKWLIRQGIEVAIITAKKSKAIRARMKPLGVKYLFQGYENKRIAYDLLCKKTGLSSESIAYLADDLPDLPILQQVKLPMAVSNASFPIKEAAQYITQQAGGHGAVREICELILKAQNKWDQVFSTYTYE